MISVVLFVLAFCCPLLGAGIGSALRRRLPERHLGRDATDVIKLAMGLMATLVAENARTDVGRVLITGSAFDRERLNWIERRLTPALHERVLRVSDLELPQMIACLSLVDCYVSSSTGTGTIRAPAAARPASPAPGRSPAAIAIR